MNEQERREQKASEEAVKIRNMDILELHNKMEQSFDRSWDSQNISEIAKSNSYFAAILIQLSQKADEKSKQVIELTQSLVDLGKRTERYTIKLIFLTKWIIGLTVIVAIIGLLPFIESFVPKNKNEKPNANKEYQNNMISSSKPLVDTLSRIKPSTTQRKSNIKDEK